MKTADYVKKYKLNISDRFDHSEFVQDLAADFIALLEINKANDNIKGFENALRAIRMKFDAISNKTVGIIPEKLWSYFFATVVVKLRDELCPKDMERRRIVQEERKQAWEQRKAFEKSQQDFFDSFWSRTFNNFWSNVFAMMPKTHKPVDSFTVLGLTESATEVDVKTAFKKLSMIHHPDKGGKQDKFVEITESKNKCLNWLQSQ